MSHNKSVARRSVHHIMHVEWVDITTDQVLSGFSVGIVRPFPVTMNGECSMRSERGSSIVTSMTKRFHPNYRVRPKLPRSQNLRNYNLEKLVRGSDALLMGEECLVQSARRLHWPYHSNTTQIVENRHGRWSPAATNSQVVKQGRKGYLYGEKVQVMENCERRSSHG